MSDGVTSVNPCITVRQATEETAKPLNDKLESDVVIAINWKVEDLHGRRIESQTCSLVVGRSHKIEAVVDAKDRSYSFRLSRGTKVGLPLKAEVTVKLSPGRRRPDKYPGGDFPSRECPIHNSSGEIPSRETMSAVYGELNQELRRMRTLYETFLVVVTGGFAALVGNADAIAGAPNRRWMGVGLAVLAVVVIFLLWQVAVRYNKTSFWISNIETAMGMTGESLSGPILVRKVEKWRSGGRLHFVWAGMLMIYTLALGYFAWAFLWQGPQQIFHWPN
jgi:hypothetical protein